MPAAIPSLSLMFAEALSRGKRPGVLKMMVGLRGRVRRGDLRDPGAECAEVETMAHWLEREHWKRADLFTARSLWSFRPGVAFRERD